jgi:VWA domain-containing protein
VIRTEIGARAAGLALLVSVAAWSLPACASSTSPLTTGQPRAAARASSPAPTPSSTPGAAAPRVTSLVLDMSGSMAWNDPDDIRCAAARAFIGFSRPGERVGVIGFNGTRATPWTRDGQAVETTAQGRDELQGDVSRNCTTPSGNTPTYDALNQAWQQLAAVPGGGPRAAVLLTDGEPTGDRSTPDLIARIEHELVPRFAQRGWRIDTIALGTDQIDITFLAAIAQATGGTFYDGSKGQRATALNLLPAFIDVLRQEGRSPGQDLDAQSAAGPLRFTVTPSAKRLDVVVVCRTPCGTITMRTPAGGQVLPIQPVTAGDGRPRFGAVFSIDEPPTQRDGGSLVPWSVTVEGGGSAAVESLVDLQLGLDLQPRSPPFALGRPLGLTARVIEADQTTHLDSTLILSGSIKHGNAAPVAFPLSTAGGGQYRGTVTIPATEQPGDYDVTVEAVHDRGQEPVATGTRVVSIGSFPVPTLDREATATRWPAPLATLYSLPLIDRLGDWAFQGTPPSAMATLTGTLAGPDGQPYVRPATVRAEIADRPGARPTVAVSGSVAGPGRFRLTFPAPAAGAYAVTLDTGGPDSFGQTIPTQAAVRVTMHDSSPAQTWYAAAVTAALALLLLLLVTVVRFLSMRPPYGEWRAGDEEYPDPLAHRRGPVEAFLSRNRIRSRDPDEGLQFRFSYRAGIAVRPRGAQGANWQLLGGDALPGGFSPEDRIFHVPTSTVYSIVTEDEWQWRHWLAALARAFGLPVRMPRAADEAADYDPDTAFIT